MKNKSRLFIRAFWSLLSLSLLGFFVLVCGYIYLESRLPDVNTLKNVQLQVPLRIYSADNLLIAEYGEKRRFPVSLSEIPAPLIHGLLATEDQRFYDHPGVDIFGLARAAVQLVRTGTKVQGGSTITMQVARNFFLNRKKTYIRKINEILLAIKIDHELSKDKILELYLNKIYFGNRAYGVAAAARVYYGKKLSELTIAQQAIIAGLPKAPSALNPINDPVAAKKRRNHVLARMLEEGYLTHSEYETARNEPITAEYHGRNIQVKAPYVAEMIRQSLYDKFGRDIYTNGFQVYTTIQSKLQHQANTTVEKNLIAYDMRHGYRVSKRPFVDIQDKPISAWLGKLQDISTVAGLAPAVVVNMDDESATAVTKSGELIKIPLQNMRWARRAINEKYLGPRPEHPRDILKLGDLIRVTNSNGEWHLRQLPEVEGAAIALNPKNGAVVSLVGGFNFYRSKFNRATQAERQPGSSFKPFIYAAALEKGYTLASIINDAPIVMHDPSQENLWRPQNDTHHFYGPTRMRIGLIRSRNLVSIRVLENIGLEYAIKYLEKFGFNREELPHSLSLALGSLNTTPIQLAGAYATFANGGFKVTPFIIDRITDARGTPIYNTGAKEACYSCDNLDPEVYPIPEEKQAKRVISKQLAYLMTSALKDVIQRGTGRAAKVLKRDDLAGKTGTTNDQLDAWFAGFNHDLVVVTWVGFDQPKTLHEYAARCALPMWIDLMGKALDGRPNSSLPQPPGIITVRIDPESGLLARSDQKKTVFEIFREKYSPKRYAPHDVDPLREANDNSLDELF